MIYTCICTRVSSCVDFIGLYSAQNQHLSFRTLRVTSTRSSFKVKHRVQSQVCQWVFAQCDVTYKRTTQQKGQKLKLLSFHSQYFYIFRDHSLWEYLQLLFRGIGTLGIGINFWSYTPLSTKQKVLKK